MAQISLVTLVVRDYDEAIAFYVGAAGLELVENVDLGAGKRWVVVRPSGGATGLLLAQAGDDAQRARIGDQIGGRVGFFLNTDDLAVERAAGRRYGRSAGQLASHTTQAVGWLPIDASRYAYTVCGGSKWLLSPRGTTFFTIRPDLMDGLVQHAAGWYAGDRPWSSIYGGPLRLAADARRYDVSPAWHSWVAAAPAVELLAAVGIEALHVHAVELATRFCVGVGVMPSASAIVSLAVDDAAAQAMQAARIVGSVRARRLRLSFHVSTSEQDVDRAIDVLGRHVVPG